MALNLEDEYPGRAQPADADYPNGSFKNESTTGANDGTPLEVAWANDREGFFQSLLTSVGVSASNVVDKVGASQLFNSVRAIASGLTRPANSTQAQICQATSAIGCSFPDEYPNYLDVGSDITHACAGTDQVTGKPIIFALIGSAVRPITGAWEYDASPVLGAALTLVFSATPDAIMDLCSDGEFLYVAWGETTGNIIINKYNVSDAGTTMNPVWSRDTGMSYDSDCLLIVADDDNLALYCGTLTSGGPAGKGVLILEKDNSTLTIGTVFSSLGTFSQNQRLVSDGAHVFWIMHGDGTTTWDFAIYSRKISDPTTSDYTNSSIVSVTKGAASSYPTGLISVGGMVLTSTPTGLIYGFSKSEDTVINLWDVPLNGAVPGGWDAMLGSDHQNVWVRLVDLNQRLAANYNVLKKIPHALMHRMNSNQTAGVFQTLDPTTVSLEKSTLSSGYTDGDFVFDGIDTWYVARNGEVFRVCAPGIR